jgi:hypothetical protein
VGFWFATGELLARGYVVYALLLAAGCLGVHLGVAALYLWDRSARMPFVAGAIELLYGLLNPLAGAVRGP